jgi:hypothetical protein
MTMLSFFFQNKRSSVMTGLYFRTFSLAHSVYCSEGSSGIRSSTFVTQSSAVDRGGQEWNMADT